MQAVSQDEIKKLRQLSDLAFDEAFSFEVQSEAKQSMRVVYFIREADRRKHWLKEFSTLASYCAKYGISNGDFYRKLSVLNTIRDIPEVEAKIVNGTLSPTTVAQVNTFCRIESKIRNTKVTLEEKRDLLLKIEGQSQREVERELARLSPQSAMPDKKRQISEMLFTNQYTSDVALEKKLSRLKEILSNSLPSSPTQNELLHKICDIALDAADPLIRAEKSAKRKFSREPKTPALVINRVISAETKRLVRMRNGDRCTFVHSTGERCVSRQNLQFDHVKPFAKGGDNSPGNLQQVCRNHNQWLAIEEFGRNKMASYLPSLN